MKHSLPIESKRQQNNRSHHLASNASPARQAFVDNRESTAIQRQLMARMTNSPKAIAQRMLSEKINHSSRMTIQRQQIEKASGRAIQRAESEEELMQGKFNPVQRVEEDELMQGKFEVAQRVEEEELVQGKFAPIQRVEEEELLQGKFDTVQCVEEEEELLQSKFSAAQLAQTSADKQNNTGLPSNLKHGVESLSGMSMDSVKVHYNSPKPAQLNALAYAQGTNIHLGAGQEKHLPHEAWHVVQQAQGRVKPTMQMAGGVPVNDDQALEQEADVMGAKAVQLVSMHAKYAVNTGSVSKAAVFSLQSVAQLKFDAGNGAQWHIHHEHIKLGTNTDSRVNFNGRSKKEIRKELGEKIDRYGLNVSGSLAASFRQCIDYINTHY